MHSSLATNSVSVAYSPFTFTQLTTNRTDMPHLCPAPLVLSSQYAPTPQQCFHTLAGKYHLHDML